MKIPAANSAQEEKRTQPDSIEIEHNADLKEQDDRAPIMESNLREEKEEETKEEDHQTEEPEKDDKMDEQQSEAQDDKI